MIPQEKCAAVSLGLREAFGVTEFEDVRKMTKGLSSAQVFRIVARGAPYLLRISTRTDAMYDQRRPFANMKQAAEAGLAPKVWYTSVEDRICITDFVEEVPLPATEALFWIPGVLRKLHALPKFSEALNYITVDKSIQRFRAASFFPKGEMEEIFSRYERLIAVYPKIEEDMVCCHNDLKPENILFDGERVWLIDWEASFANDRYYDLAIVANFLVRSEAEETVFLHAYLGKPADEVERARLFLMRQVMHVLYAAFFSLFGASDKKVEEKLPSFQDFHRRIWAGEVDLSASGMKTIYARVHWEQLLENMWQSRFQESLEIVAERYAGADRLLPEAVQKL